MSKDNDPIAWQAAQATGQLMCAVPPEQLMDFLTLIMAGLIEAVRAQEGDEFVRGFLDAAAADLKGAPIHGQG